jgi:hypothetical protein
LPLSWNEIKHRAIAFSKAWSGETSEDAEAKSFWDAFFMVFGVQRRTVASFEEPVKKLSGQWGYIDLFCLFTEDHGIFPTNAIHIYLTAARQHCPL